MPANSRWDLIRGLKGFNPSLTSTNMNGNWHHVYDFNFPYLLSDVQLIVLYIHRYRKVYFLVYIAGLQNVTPHKLNTNFCATEFTTVLWRWIGYNRPWNTANPPPIPECQFDHSLYVYSKPNLWPLGNQAGGTSHKVTLSSGRLQHSLAAAQKFSVFYKSPPLSPILTQINPVYTAVV